MSRPFHVEPIVVMWGTLFIVSCTSGASNRAPTDGATVGSGGISDDGVASGGGRSMASPGTQTGEGGVAGTSASTRTGGVIGVGGTGGDKVSVALYPGPSGIAKSDRYEVLVNGQSSFTYQSRSQLNNSDSVSWTTFSFSGGPVDLEIRRLMGGPLAKVVVRPLRRSVQTILAENSVYFRLSSPAKLSVEFDDDLVNKLFIFADPPEIAPPLAGDPNVLYFGPGIHDVGMNYRVESGKTMYVAGGAVVRGTFSADGTRNIKVRGRGILSSRAFAHIDGPGQFKLRNVTGGEVEGVTLIESPGYILTGFGSKSMQYRNLKLIGWYVNTDGIHPGNSAVVDDVFIFNNDDCMIVGLNSEDVRVTNAVLWANRAAALQLSWVAERGQNVRVKGVDVIHYQSKPDSISGAIGMRHGGPGHLSDFQFEDIVVEHFGAGSHRTFVYLQITPHAYLDGPLGSLSNVLFKNVRVLDATMNNRIIGRDAGHMISDITFENLIVDGKVAFDAASARVVPNEFTRNIRFVAAP